MMKKIFTLIALILTTLSYSQVGNPSFENWESPMLPNTLNVSTLVPVPGIGNVTVYLCDTYTYNELEDWSSTNQLTKADDMGGVELVTLSTDAVDGASSVKIESKEMTLTGHVGSCTGLAQSVDNTTPGLIVNGSFTLDAQSMIDDLIAGTGLDALNPFSYPGVGEEIDFIPKTLTGSYKYTGGVAGTDVDSCIIVSGLKKNGEVIGVAIARFGNASSYTPFTLEYEHFSCEIPDTIVTLISSSSIDFTFENGDFVVNSDFTGIDGSVLYVDNLHLDAILPSEFPPLLNNDFDTIITTDVSTVAVLANDDFCGTVFPISLYYSGTEGVAVINGSNEIEFTPTSGFVGTVQIPYYSCNSVPLCDTAILTVVVNPVPACVAEDDVYTVTGSSIETDPRLNDVDCGTVVSLVTNPAKGIAVVLSNNNLKYTPNNGFVGEDSLVYQICSPINTSQCSTAKIYYTIITSIDEIENSLIRFYPNPAKDVLNISVALASEMNVRIFNTLGNEVYSNSFMNSIAIDLNTINSGIYFVEIETEEKKSVRKLQLIK